MVTSGGGWREGFRVTYLLRPFYVLRMLMGSACVFDIFFNLGWVFYKVALVRQARAKKEREENSFEKR